MAKHAQRQLPKWAYGLLGLALTGLLIAPATSMAANADNERHYFAQAMTKLGRGIANIATAPFEIVNNGYKEQQRAQDDDARIGYQSGAALRGAFMGVGYSVARLLVGTADVVSFLVPSDPFMKPVVANIPSEMVGPPSPHGFFRLSRHGGRTPLRTRHAWQKPGASVDDFYEARFDCAARTVRNGLFNECLEAKGWTERYRDGVPQLW